MPTFITGLDSVLDQLSTWMLYLVPGLIILTFVIGGLMLTKTDDAMDVKKIKDKMKLSIVGAAIAGSATWIGNWLWGIFY
ncbi:hypothetical protein ACFYKX_25345 [Cytobacillus sp. FJAT-54145]|uniref:Uncharacterized protein n=1 Tax=Cytobacillus spartinae TaxID=3299023 RepID=A0ABW6KIB3_9BACI